MMRFVTSSAEIRLFCAALSCLAMAACGGSNSGSNPNTGAGNSGTGTTPPPTGAGTGATPGTAGTTAVGTSGTAATPGGGRAGTGTAMGMAGRGTTAGTGAAGVTATGGTGTAGTTGTPTPTGSGSVLQYHGNAARDGHYVDAAFTRAAAAMLKKDPTFMGVTSGTMQAQPLYVEAGAAGKDLVIAATATNEVTALDAATGAMVWKTMLAPVAANAGCSIQPVTVGVVGTPVIDAATKTLYVAAMTAGPKQQVFALGLEDGKIKTGWPADISKVSAGGVTFNSAGQNQRGALIIVGDMVYVPYGGFNGDCGDYHGWVVGIPLSNPAAPIGFATKANGAGIWTPGGLASDGTSVFAATGNSMARPDGLFSSPATWGHGNAILRLGKDLKNIEQSATKDFFAAENWSQLDMGDLDIGGSGPVLFSVPGATPSELAMALGKGGGAYLLDRTNLGGMGSGLKMLMVASGGISGGMIQSAAAYTTTTGTFVAFRSVQQVAGCGSGTGYIGGLKIEAASPPTMKVAWCGGANGQGSPIVTTTDGKSDSVVWYLGGGKLLGLNGETGETIYNGGGASDGTGSVQRWQTPIVAKGRIFVGTNSGVVAYTTK
jgi:hypothetical protein